MEYDYRVSYNIYLSDCDISNCINIYIFVLPYKCKIEYMLMNNYVFTNK